MEKWLKTLSIKELSTWINNFDNFQNNLLLKFVDNSPNEEDLKTAKKILKNKRAYLKRQIMEDTHISFN
jgi:hypothetical protein|tara:strand:+ start:103 stop:309 length:207 start_codon:yes stop_codon:yes gene_type:complete